MIVAKQKLPREDNNNTTSLLMSSLVASHTHKAIGELPRISARLCVRAAACRPSHMVGCMQQKGDQGFQRTHGGHIISCVKSISHSKRTNSWQGFVILINVLLLEVSAISSSANRLIRFRQHTPSGNVRQLLSALGVQTQIAVALVHGMPTAAVSVPLAPAGPSVGLRTAVALCWPQVGCCCFWAANRNPYSVVSSFAPLRHLARLT